MMMSLSSRLLLSRSTAATVSRCTVIRCFTATEPEKFQYIQPLSQIVVEHLQSNRADWVERNGLERGLILKRDGSFELRFPSFEKDGARIWASFDDEEKKHWLNVHKGELVGRYMLQDNLRPAWHSDERSVPEKICDAVDAMIMKVDQEGDKRRSDLK